MQLRNQLVNAAKNFAKGESLSSVLITTMSKDMDEQFKLAHKVIDVVDRAKRKICVTLLRYNVNKHESASGQVQLFARKKDDEKFQEVFYVNYKLEEFIYLLDVMSSVYDKNITNQPICNVLKKIISSLYSSSILFLFESRWVGTLEMIVNWYWDFDKTDSKKKILCLKWTTYYGRTKVYANFRLIKTSWILSCTVTETVYTSKVVKLFWSSQNTSHSWQNEFISWAKLTYSTSGELFWMKQPFIIQTNSIKNGCSLPHEHFPILPRIKNVVWTQ